jgi:hypothetical protein
VLGLRGGGGALGLLHLADDAVECTACPGLDRIHVTLPRAGQDPRYFAQKAERRARFALGYLVLIGVALTLIFASMLW